MCGKQIVKTSTVEKVKSNIAKLKGNNNFEPKVNQIKLFKALKAIFSPFC